MEENKIQIPEGWENKYGYEIFKVQGGYAFKSDDYKDEGVLLVRIGNVGNGKFQYKDVVYVPKRYLKSHKNFLLTKGDVLMGLTGDLGKICILKSGNFPFILNQRVAKFNPINFSNDYLNYLLSSQIVQNNFDALFAGGAQKNISPANIEGLKYLIPKSLTEQKKIAEILSTVDKAIEQTEQLIAKYQRIKTGLMQDLLTKGIDKNGNIRSEETHEFKDSPLGRIPVEWECVDFGAIAFFKNGLNYNKNDEGKGLKIIGVSDFKSNFSINYNNLQELKGFYNIDESYLLKDGDLLFVRSNGNKDLIGRVLLIEGIKDKVSFSGFTIKAKISSIVYSKYVAYLFNFPKIRKQLIKLGGGTNINNLSQEILSQIKLLIPKKQDEQLRLLEIIDKSFEVHLKEQTKLQKLQRIKTALMQDLLSGQKRVTNLLKEEAL